MLKRSAACLLTLALVVSACTPSDDTTSDAQANTDDTSGGSSGDSTASGSSDTDDASEPVSIPILTTSETVVSTGSSFTVTADPTHTGSVAMRSGDEVIASAPLEDGTATIRVPSGTAVGLYALETVDDGAGRAIGVIGIADGPTLWLTTPKWTTSGVQHKATITTFGIPTGMTVALELTGDGQMPERLVPHAIAGLAPIAFGADPGEGIPHGRTTWKLPEGFTGTIRVVADQAENLGIFADTEDPPAVTSAETRVRRCDEVSGITGNLGESGWVSVLRLSGGFDSASTATDNGSFTIPVDPGTMMVSAGRGLDATASSPQFVQIKCGEVLDVGSMDEALDTGPAPGTYLGRLTLDEAFLFTSSGTGDIEFSHENVTDCSVNGSELELGFTGQGSDLHFYYVTIPDYNGTGRYDAAFQIINVLKDGESTGTATIEIEQGRIEGFDAVGGAFTATYEGALGSGTVEGRFTCIFFTALETSRRAIRGAAPVGGVRAAPYFASGGARNEDVCRTAFVAGQGSYQGISGIVAYYTTRIFNEHLPKTSALTMSDVHALLDLAARQQLLGTEDEDQVDIYEVAGALASDYLLSFKATDISGSWILSVTAFDVESARVFFRQDYTSSTEGAMLDHALADDVVAAFREIGICGEVEEESVQVASGEEKELTYTLTNLAGEAAEGAIDAVSSTCGRFEPESGNAENGEFKTTFTGGDGGCTDQVTFVARTDTSVGEVTTEQDGEESTTAIAIPMFGYRYTIDMDSTTSAGAYSSGSATIHAESEGEFFIEPDFQQIIGAGSGTVHAGDPAAPCVLITESGTVTRPQVWNADGTYRVMVSGDLASGTAKDGGTLHLLPDGFGIAIVGSWSDPECFPPGSQSNEIWSYLVVSIFVVNPALVVGQFPQGFEMSFTADGKPTEKTWPITVGTGTGSVTIEVWQMTEDAG